MIEEIGTIDNIRLILQPGLKFRLLLCQGIYFLRMVGLIQLFTLVILLLLFIKYRIRYKPQTIQYNSLILLRLNNGKFIHHAEGLLKRYELEHLKYVPH
jgi:hypothetical protein